MQVATVSLEIFSEFCSWLDFSKQNKSAAPQWEIEKKGDRRETQKEGRARGRGKGHFLMMKDEDSRYHRKQSCKYSLLHTQFSEKWKIYRDHLYLLTCWQIPYTPFNWQFYKLNSSFKKPLTKFIKQDNTALGIHSVFLSHGIPPLPLVICTEHCQEAFVFFSQANMPGSDTSVL